ncbi:MAG: hypothetical protein IT318_20240 [Anaerolineales bacterium]|nr:hypothetical protein [Anaerolineales bacterium]
MTTPQQPSAPTGITVPPPQQPAVMQSTEAYPVASAHGQLSVLQRRFLSLRLSHATDAECATAIGLKRDGTVSDWKRESPAFAAAYQHLMDAGIEEWANAERRRLLGKALLTAEELLTAEDDVRAKDGTLLGTTPAWRARRDGMEGILRANGLWNPQERGSSETAGLVDVLRAMSELTRASRGGGESAPAAHIIIEGSSDSSTVTAAGE